jgi:hypothetical protein
VSTTLPLALEPHLNAICATSDDDRASAAVNAWGNSFPAEELPFGRTLTVRACTYRLAAKSQRGFDHVEALGQTLSIDPVHARAISVLCFGEMGCRSWAFEFEGEGTRKRCSLTAPGWLVERGAVLPGEAFSCTHLHYPAYELDLLRPVAWSRSCRFQTPWIIERLTLPISPLVHVLAISIETE